MCFGGKLMNLAEALALQLEGTRDWTLKLIADLSGDDWTFQPAPGLAHPLWLCGHLAVSQHVLVHVRCLGRACLDEAFAAQFQMGGPVPAAGAWSYPPVERVLEVMADMQTKTLASVRGMSDALLAAPCLGKDGAPHPHYRDKRGAVAHCDRHEAFHAGQIGLIRRLRGKAFLR